MEALLVDEIIIEEYGLGHVVAWRINSNLVDLYFDPINTKIFYPQATVLFGRIERKVKWQGGYFIKLPNGLTGFLLSRNNYQSGQKVIVQAKVFFDIHKAQRFTDRIKSESKFFVITSGKKNIFFSRSLTESATTQKIKKILFKSIELSNLEIDIIVRASVQSIDTKSLSYLLAKEIERYTKLTSPPMGLQSDVIALGPLSRERALFSFGSHEHVKINERAGIFDNLGLWDTIYKYTEKKVSFGNGSYLIIEQTSAFCSIDVNTGEDFNVGKGEINLNSIEHIVIAIRIKGSCGKIIIDFLPCSKKVKKEIFQRVKKHFSNDKIKTDVKGWTMSGNFELERDWGKPPLKYMFLD